MILVFGNTKDFNDTIFSGNKTFQIKIDDRHNLFQEFKKTKERIISKTADGKRNIYQVFSYNEHELSFIVNTDDAQFIARLKLYDLFTIDGVQPDEYECEISDITGNSEQYNKIIITYRDNFINKTGDNYIDVNANSVPQALDVLISGINKIGEELTGSYNYFDVDEDLEGTSTFEWWRADNEAGLNKEKISGETSQTYTQTTIDYNKYIYFKVTPIALTGESPGIMVESPGFQSEINKRPTAIHLAPILKPIECKYSASYKYFDTEGDLEGTSTFIWYIASDEYGLNEYMAGTGNNIFVTFNSSFRWIRFSMIPKALTGVLIGIELYSMRVEMPYFDPCM